MKQIVLGISGSIAAYKSPEIIRICRKKGLSIKPILTKNACKFVTPTTISTVSETQAYVDHGDSSATIPHLELLKNADAFIIAPASANIIAKCAHGIADDLLTAMFLSYTGPKLIVPAMHTEMYENPITQENIQKLKKSGVKFLGPESGELACGDIGKGRLADPEIIADWIEYMTFPQIDLSGKKILITAGGTKEPIDKVRVVTNLSSGKLGHTLANLASFYGATVSLITTVTPPNNPHINITKVTTVYELKESLESQINAVDYLYMAAAVSDFTFETSSKKLKREKDHTFKTKKTPDILKSLAESKTSTQVFIGFCLEDDNLDDVAQEKLKKKKCNYIIANTSANFGADTRSIRIFSNKGLIENINQTPLNTACCSILKTTTQPH